MRLFWNETRARLRRFMHPCHLMMQSSSARERL